MIAFENDVFLLTGRDYSYAFRWGAFGHPEHLHFGAPVGSDLFMGVYDDKGRIHPAIRLDGAGNKYDLCTISQELCSPYGGDYYEPSLVLEFSNGSRRCDLVYSGHEILSEKPMPEGLPGIREGQTLAVYLTAKDVKVTLFYTVSDSTATIVRSMKVENLGAEVMPYEFAGTIPWMADGTAERS